MRRKYSLKYSLNAKLFLFRSARFENAAVFHDERDFFERVDIVRRIFGHGDDVGVSPDFDRAGRLFCYFIIIHFLLRNKIIANYSFNSDRFTAARRRLKFRFSDGGFRAGPQHSMP